MIHAIGAGLVIYEVQQNSDTTYRVFDWTRVGLDDQPRALHVQESLRSIDFSATSPDFQQPDAQGVLIDCEFFKIRHSRPKQVSLGIPGENLAIAMIKGQLSVAGRRLRSGEFAIVPAILNNDQRLCHNSADVEWVEIQIP
jgi:mannose-6-phosphate isomerase